LKNNARLALHALFNFSIRESTLEVQRTKYNVQGTTHKNTKTTIKKGASMKRIIYLSICSSYVCGNLFGFSVSSVFNWFSPKYSSVISKEFVITGTASLSLHNTTGDIAVTCWKHQKIMFTATTHAKTKQIVDQTRTNLIFDTKTNALTIDNQQPPVGASTTTYELVVPYQTDLYATIEKHGDIRIHESAGSLHLSTQKGRIVITLPTGPVEAHSDEGAIKVTVETFSDTSSLLLQVGYGKIKLKVPHDLQAILEAHTDTGTIFSEIPITLTPRTMLLNKNSWQECERHIQGTMGDGGSPITLNVSKGDIVIKELRK
jgi:hypothetical protein